MNKEGPVLELREIRHQISQEFNHDPEKYIDYLKRQKGKYLSQVKQYENLINKALATNAHSSNG